MTTSDVKYSVKIINPENKGGFIVEDWKDQKFYTKESLEEKISLQFSKYSSDTDFQLGYLCPGHGFKGKQIAIDTDEDLKTMYEKYDGKKSVIMWLKLKERGKKRSSNTVDGASNAKRAKNAKNAESLHLEKMDDLQRIVGRLQEKHKDTKYSHFSNAQFHCWSS